MMKTSLLIELVLVLLSYVHGRGIDLKVCGNTYFNCNCGTSGNKLSIPIKECTYFYRWKPYCKPCEDIKENAYCSKYAHCLTCNKDVDRCVQCPPNRYGQWCAGACQCQNGATCEPVHGHCQCLQNYEGRFCEIKINPTCPSPESPVNGVVTWVTRNIGDTVTYSCNDEYAIVGPRARTCTSDTTWSQHTPHCEKVCPAVTLLPHLNANTVPHGISATFVKSMTFHCESGYEIVGQKTITCLPTGAWDAQLPKCVTRCLALAPPQHGEVTYTDLTLKEGTTAKFSCKKDYLLVGGKSDFVCLGNSTWSRSQTPHCEKTTYCLEPEVQQQTSVLMMPGAGGDYSEGTNLTYSCNLGAILVGTSKIRCQKNGEWSNVPPTCTTVYDKDITCSTTGADMTFPSAKSPLRIYCPGKCHEGNTNVWGTAIYKKESKVCAAAIHSGMIQNEGGSVYVVNNGNYSLYSSSTSNNIKSKRSRTTSESFRFEHIDEDMVTCPEGWQPIGVRCYLAIDKPSSFEKSSLLCQNLAATITISVAAHEQQTRQLLHKILDGKDSSNVWIGDEDYWKKSRHVADARVDKNGTLDNETISSVRSYHQLLNNMSVDHIIFQEDSCTSYNFIRGFQSTSCTDQVNFICEKERRIVDIREEDECTDPGRPKNGKSEASGTVNEMFVENSTLTFRCNSLHYLEGQETIRCMANNTWDAEVPVCTKVTTCSESLNIKNGMHVILPELNFRTTSNQFPKALSIPAFRDQNLSTIYHKVNLPSGHHRVGARIQFNCESKFYNLIGSNTRACMPDGQWSGRQPTCQPVCGISSSPRAPFIVNGKPTKIGQWPWQVAFARKEIDLDATADSDRIQWFIYCGGSLVTESWIITAAHCVTHQESTTIFNLDDLKLYFGKYYRNHSLDDTWVQIRNVAEIHVYPDFNPVLYDGDVALVRVNEPVQLTSRVQPVCLPDKLSGISERHLQPGSIGVVTGWGTDDTNSFSSTLLQADIPVVTSSECEAGYMEAGMPLSVTGNMFCAGFAEKGKDDACGGDSGGPFVVADGSGVHERWYLEGVVSWGSPIGCGNERQYGGYSKISAFLTWIMQFI